MRPIPHGTPRGYWRGCRCTPCRAAVSQYETARADDGRRLVDAAEVWAHVAPAVAKIGVARVAAAAGTSRACVRRIRDGQTLRVRVSTVRRLLGALDATKADGDVVAAHDTKRRLAHLVAEGFSLDAISAVAGVSVGQLRAIGHRVRVRTARRLLKAHRQLIGTTPDR